MKILHFADLHLGVETHGRTDPATGLSTRLLDCLSALDRLVDYAIENHADLVVFAGDAYKTREPTQTQQREFARRINRLSEAEVPVFLLVGNHDLPNAIGRATATEIFDTLAVKNVYVSARPDISLIQTRSGPVQVASLPWLRRGALLAREDARGLGLEQVKARLEEALTNMVASLAERLDPALPAILTAHVWATGALDGSERLMTLGNEPGLLLSNIANPAFDYVALGHIHRHQVLSENPPVVYAGSLERLDFGDEDDEKGFYEVDITADGASRRTAFNFRALAGRRFVTLKVEVSADDPDPTETVLRSVRQQAGSLEAAIVRLSIDTPQALAGQIREGEIREALKDAHNFTVSRLVQRQARQRLGSFAAEELTPLAALKAYLESKDLAPERVKLLLEHGEKLISGDGG